MEQHEPAASTRSLHLPALRFDLPGDRLQDLRFLQAMAESHYRIRIASEHLWKLQSLREVFGLQVSGLTGDEVLLSDYEIVHEFPMTRLGSIQRPLIFPHAFFTYLRQQWPSRRDIDFSFIGLITPIRVTALNAWLKRQGVSKRVPHPQLLRAHSILQRKLQKWLHVRSKGRTEFTFKTEHGKIMLGASDKGRTFPGKAWDDEYFKMLSRSRFVLCPVGDFVWTYRFFESMMCGAIPIAEASCASYEGFRYYTMEDDLAKIEWSAETAEYNFHLCMQRLTVPHDELNVAIEKLIGD